MLDPRRLLLPACALLLTQGVVQAAEVTVYRCTDAKGALSLRDTPCRAGEKQETRSMVRPQDPPPRAQPILAPTPTAAPREPIPRYVLVTPPRPLYECVGGDGERYTSETGEGRAHWEPGWMPAYPIVAYPRDAYAGGYSARVTYTGKNITGSVRLGDPRPTPPRVAVVPAYATGNWVRDRCYPLPQEEVCDRLRDERFDLNRRWNIAQPSERAQIDRETRGIDARLANDCGGS